MYLWWFIYELERLAYFILERNNHPEIIRYAMVQIAHSISKAGAVCDIQYSKFIRTEDGAIE